MFLKRFIILFFIGLLFLACADHYIKTTKARGVYHRVKSGETLWRIAQAYHINVQELAEVNNIEDPDSIKMNSAIFIPDADQIVDDVMSIKIRESSVETDEAEKPASRGAVVREKEIASTAFPRKQISLPEFQIRGGGGLAWSEKKVMGDEGGSPAKVKDESGTNVPKRVKDSEKKVPVNKEVDILQKVPPKMAMDNEAEREIKQGIEGRKSEDIHFDKKRFIWPLNGKVLQRFGIQPNGMYNNGIKIAAKEGAPVHAAAAGNVIFSAPLKGYGGTIIIKHEEGFTSVYTHLDTRLAGVNDGVKKGDKIALLDKSDKVGDYSYLNFEIRYKNKARNPLFFLP